MRNRAGIIPFAMMAAVMIGIWAAMTKMVISDIKESLITLEHSVAGLASVIIIGGTFFTVQQTHNRNMSRRTVAIAGFSTTAAAILTALALSIVTGNLEGMPTRIIIISLMAGAVMFITHRATRRNDDQDPGGGRGNPGPSTEDGTKREA